MATVLRRRLLVNPARKRKNRARRNRKKLTAKQIRYFGTPAQKAALRRKRANAHRSNPKKKAHRPRTRPRTAPRKSSRRRKNVSEIITASLAGLANPARRKRKSKKQKRTNMAKARSNRKHAARRPSHHKKHYSRRQNRRNGYMRHNRRSHRHHRHNPPRISGITSVLIDAGWAAGGAIGSRALTQVVLQSNNTGIMGYGANLISGFLLSWGAKGLLRNGRAAADIMMGTLIGVILRALQDFTPLGQAAQLSGLGDFLATTFFMPRVLTDPRSGQIVLPDQVSALANTGAKNPGVGAFYSRRMYGR